MGATLRVLAALALALPAAAAERVVELPTRPGATLRALIDAPPAAIGSVVLLAGGNGELELEPDGKIGNFYGNPVIRTRARYVAAGLAFAAPDVASDLRTGDGPQSWPRQVSAEHLADLAATIAHMRAIAAPVAVIGFSRGVIPAVAASRLSGPGRPDALVLISGMWFTSRATPISVDSLLSRDGAFTQPSLLIVHAEDACPFSAGAEMTRIAARLGDRNATLVLRGGGPPRGDRCGPFHFHGHVGIDGEVIEAVVAWLRALPR